jgi:CRP/FNR family cyclic AMP-dependent transcriptional regulator
MAKLDRDAKRAALTASPLFQAMKPSELDEIVKLASEQRWPRGATIFQKGDEGSSMMAVLRGRVRVSAVSADGREITLNVISPGEIFGEIALLDGKPRSADASAIEETTLLVVERKQFLPFLKQNDDLYLRLLAVLCDRLRRTSLALEGIALFDLPARIARLLLKLAEDYGRATSAHWLPRRGRA